MVLILNGNREHVAHVWSKIGLIWKRNVKFKAAVDLNYWQIKLPIPLFTCPPFSELPSNSIKSIKLIEN